MVTVAVAVFAGAIAGVPVIAERRADDVPAVQLVPDAAPTADPEANTVVTEPALRPWLEPDDVPAPIDDTPDPDELERSQLEQCRLDYGTMTAVATAYVTQTRSLPDDPDEVETTWLSDKPDGWNNQWDFNVNADGLTVIPVPGGTCDL